MNFLLAVGAGGAQDGATPPRMVMIHLTNKLSGLFMVSLLAVSAVACAADGRTTVPLNGTWQIAEGTLEEVPKRFDHQAPVPGLADMAVPAFEGVGTKGADPRRAAFWYRRTFAIAGPVPAVARLKVHKARYGTRVYLNGHSLGEHVGCFTPGYFDLGGKLQGGGEANELLIRVGAAHTALGDDVPWGHDFEKLRYIPGIYDDVELVLSGSPDIANVQVVPDVPGRQVRVVARVSNPGADGSEALLRCTVREAKTGKTAGTADSRKVVWKAGEQQNIEVVVPLENCRLWTPEEPFLYEAEVSVVAGAVVTDAQTTRFGMRSFAFDPQTKRPMLNGQPYYLRGTNICIDRFFEDPLRGDKPWREAWVRSLIRAFRGMHWNSARYCIGFPPELWYRIADEEGLLVQDEFPVWGETGSLENLTKQYGEWMEERWNHPSVVIWDAQNETPKQDITGKALAAVRHLDLSNRPWDNGWGEGQSPTDVYETHPYRHIDKNFRMTDLAGMAPRPDNSGKFPGNPLANAGDRPIIVNEYGWLWINRDGTPCTLPVEYKSYQYLLPPNPSADQYREAYARTLAAKTEFWRAGRQLAGVMHFCGLGYSRPGGQTSDSLSDVEQPAFEPHFAQYVKDAFAPVGVMLDFWAADCQRGATLKLPVVVINDLATDWHGPVRLRISNESKVLAEMTQDARVAAFGREVIAFELKVPEVAGQCRLVAELPGADGQPVKSLRDVSVR